MAHLTLASAQTFALHGVTFTSFARSSTGATANASWRADFSPHTPGQPHSMSEEETIYVISGQLAVEIDDESFDVPAGDAVLIPANSRLRVSNAEDSPAAAWVSTPLGMRATMTANGTELSPPWAQ